MTLLATTIFCRLISSSAIAYAPDSLVIDYPVTNIEWRIDEKVDPPREWATTNVVIRHKSVLAPTESDYLASGWLKNGILPPVPPDGMVVGSKTYEQRGESVIAVYEYVAIPVPEPTPKLYSRLSIYVAMAKLGVWDKVKSWLETKEIEGVNGWTAFELAQEIKSTHPMFETLASEACELLGMTRDRFDAIMDQCILEQ